MQLLQVADLAFVFAYACCWYSHGAARFSLLLTFHLDSEMLLTFHLDSEMQIIYWNLQTGLANDTFTYTNNLKLLRLEESGSLIFKIVAVCSWL